MISTERVITPPTARLSTRRVLQHMADQPDVDLSGRLSS
jgi:hypothetical protein